VAAIAITTGASGNVSANTVTTLVVADADITSVTNPSHAQGGVDAETDDQFRTRIVERILLKNQGTLKYYEALAKEIDEEAFRVYACKGESTREVAIYVMNRSGTGMSAADRDYLENSIKNYAPVCAVPKVYNIPFTDVDIYAKISLQTGYTLQDVFEKMLVNLADFINWAEMDFGVEIDDADILSIVNGTEGVKDVDMSTFQPNANVECANNSIPRVGTVVLVNMNDTGSTINFSPITSYIYRYDT
jgi:phage-related baseplate assembly protein